MQHNVYICVHVYVYNKHGNKQNHEAHFAFRTHSTVICIAWKKYVLRDTCLNKCMHFIIGAFWKFDGTEQISKLKEKKNLTVKTIYIYFLFF